MARRALVLVALLAAVLGLLPTPAGADGKEPRVPYVVRFRPGTSPEEQRQALKAAGMELLEHLRGGDFALVRGAPRSIFRAQQVHEAIVESRPPVRVHASAIPNDPYFGFQWNLTAVQAPAAWDVATGVGVTVAVLDTGVARNASDLAATHFVDGWDFVQNDGQPDDENGHGTHVAGTIAQATGNGLGAAGLAHGATIMPLRVLDAAGSGTDWTVAQALRHAVDHGARVANLSIGADGPSSLLADAVAYAHAAGVTVVAASGNQGGPVAYPAAYEQVLAVGAVRVDRTRAAYSNTGAALDLAAPGGDLSVDQNGDGYGDGILQQTIDNAGQYCWCFMQGTSMAAPHVSAAAALLLSAGADGPADVRAALQSSAVDLGAPGWDPLYGHGLLQAHAALLTLGVAPPAASPPAAPPVPTVPPAVVPKPVSPPPLPPVTKRPAEPEPDEPESDEAEPARAEPRSIDRSCPAGTVPGARFGDLTDDNPHRRAVDCLAWWGLARGRSASVYAPAATVSRGELATFVARLVERSGGHLPTNAPNRFGDDDGSAHAPSIDRLAAVGIVTGRSDGTYAPGAPVTRGQLATILVRALEHRTSTQLDAGGDHFGDDDGSDHERNIDKAAEAGVTGGRGERRYEPASAVRRDQMASFLARALDLLIEGGYSTSPAAALSR